MREEMSHEERALAEIEQGKRYRQQPARRIRLSKNVWLALILVILFAIGLPHALRWGHAENEFNYWNPLGGVIDSLIPVGKICLAAGIVIVFGNNWKLDTCAAIVLVFLFLPVAALINAPIFHFQLGDIEHLTSVPYREQMYHLEVQSFSGIYYHLYECDRTGTWCHEVQCFPYEEADTNPYARQLAESFPICSTGKPVPTPTPVSIGHTGTHTSALSDRNGLSQGGVCRLGQHLIKGRIG